jgi:hypothetical protein
MQPKAKSKEIILNKESTFCWTFPNCQLLIECELPFLECLR